MKGIFTFLLTLFFCTLSAQENPLEPNHREGLDKAKLGDYTGAIISFTKAIEVHPMDAYVWYNRAMAKNMIGEYEDALNDFGTSIALNPAYGKVWFNRGLTKMYLTQYDGAIFDLTHAIKIEREYAAAFYYRAYIYELRGLYEFACTDYRNAKSKGHDVPKGKLMACQDSSYQGLARNSLLFLTEKSKKCRYGYSMKQAIGVGSAENRDIYLRLLRSPEGKYVNYTLLENSGLSKVQLNYSVKGKNKTKVIYFDLEKFDSPKLIKGFTTFKVLSP